ncbi:hypothetical protein BOTBODRAFT_122280 [Botryobasidium botryosum FD-172 SS1]|uniref:Uncharacterized protein n=1 Tax=Botryobasidium botryosum (strain FD-172 SS1) TaxID=930990 RepID=A0A067M1P8_BOTB1|nr:hypothetical protein BOTBODRAFT_122280 [Botryobasidium botryosum FD-172 SS1]
MMNMKGHTAMVPCRTCRIIGCLCPTNSHYYYPITAPDGWDGNPHLRQARPAGIHYDVTSLPYRDNVSHGEHIELIKSATNATAVMQSFGINGDCILRNLSSLKFPWSFPFGMAHLICLNVVPRLVEHAIGEFQTVSNVGQPYAVPKAVWKHLCAQLEASTATVPASYGRHFRDISQHKGYMVAEDWLNFTLFAALPMFATIYTSKETRPCLDLWALLVEVVEDGIQYSIKRDSITLMEEKIQKFVSEYERFVSTLLILFT